MRPSTPFIICVGLIGLSVILLLILVFFPLIQIMVQLSWHFAFGIIYYPLRILPAIQIRSVVAAIVMGFIAAVVLACVGRLVFGRLNNVAKSVDQLQATQLPNLEGESPIAGVTNQGQAGRLFTLACLTILAGVTSGMMLGELGMLMTDRHSLFEVQFAELPPNYIFQCPEDFGVYVNGIERSRDGTPEPDETRDSFFRHRSAPLLLETHHVGTIDNPDGSVFCWILFARDPDRLAAEGVLISAEYRALPIKGVSSTSSLYESSRRIFTLPAVAWPSVLEKLHVAAIATTQPGGFIWAQDHPDRKTTPAP